MATLGGIPANIAQPFNRHDYNGHARVTPKADRANVKVDWTTWVTDTYIPAAANAIPLTDVTNADPAVVTSVAHGLSNGNVIILMGVSGIVNNTQNDRSSLNELQFTVAGVTANTFQLANTNTVSYTSYASDGSFFVLPTGFSYTGLAYT